MELGQVVERIKWSLIDSRYFVNIAFYGSLYSLYRWVVPMSFIGSPPRWRPSHRGVRIMRSNKPNDRRKVQRLQRIIINLKPLILTYNFLSFPDNDPIYPEINPICPVTSRNFPEITQIVSRFPDNYGHYREDAGQRIT